MYSVSSEFISAIKEASREFKSKVLIGEDEYSDDKVINFILEKSMAPSDEFSLGAVVASKFELTIALADIRNNKIIKPYIALKVGKDFEYVPLGVFNIEEKSIQNGVVNIKCFDNIGKFEKPYFSDLSYPIPIQRVANEICSKAGVTLATTLPTLNIDKKIDGYTCREALSFIASACGGFAIANRAGAIEIKNVGPSISSINGDNYFTFENDDTFVIKKLTAHIDENTVISRGEGIGVEEVEFKNPIANNQIMDYIYSKLKNYTYVPGNLVWQGSPALDVGEKMSVTDIGGIKRDILIMRDKITYSGGLRGETNSVAKSLGKSNFNYGGSMQGAVDRVTAEQIVVKELLADKANISDLNAINANIENLTVSKADIEQLQATNANIENLKANKANISDLNATNAIITNLQATKADIVDLTAATGKITVLESEVAKIGVLEGDVANIQDIVNGNLSSENIQTGGITGDRLNMNTIFVNDANIVNVNASKVNAGEIDTSKVKVKSADGGVEIVGATQQFRDKNNKVRIQMGKDTKGDFNFIIKGEDGTTTLIDHTGVKENAIADDLIQDNMIAPDAVGEKQIDYNSFSTGFNKDTNTSQIKGTKVRLDNQNQSLEVAFTSLKSKADGTQTQTESNTTQINVQQGQISTAIANTKIVKDNKEVLLKDDYNTTVATVNSMKNTISSHTTKIDNNTGKITGVESKTNVLERDLNSMSSKISATETTVKTHTTQINTVTGTANSAIDKANKANEKVDTLEIGGINLLKNTTNTFKEFIANTTEWYKQFGSDIKLEVGFYVISWDCIVLEGYKPYISIGCGTKGNFNRDIAQSNKNMATSKSFVFEVKESHLADDYVYFAYRFRNDKNASNFKVKCEKLEHGTKATSWENISDGIDKNKNDIITVNTEVATTKNKVSGIEQNLDSITTRVGSVESTTTTHTATINSHTSSLNAVDGKINTAKTEAINTSKADATTKSNDAKNQALSGAATDAQNKANKALNDAKGYTNAEVTKVNSTMTSKFAEIKTTTDSISQTVSNTNKEVSTVKVNVTNAQNTANTANSKIDNLQVGGRNLITNSAPKNTYGWNSAGVQHEISVIDESTAPNKKALKCKFIANGTNGGVHKPPIFRLESGKKYSWSVYLKANKNIKMNIGSELGGVKTFDIGTGWQRHDYTFIATNTQYYSFIFYVQNPIIGTEYYIHSLKLSDGDKTSWTQAPEDTSKEILDITTEKVNQAKSDIKITTDAISSKVSQVESTTNSINGKVNTHESRLASAEQKITPNAIVSTVTSSSSYTNAMNGKVSTNKIISEINQSVESIKIAAAKLTLNGAVTIKDSYGKHIKIEDCDYSVFHHNVRKASFGIRNEHNNNVQEIIPNLKMGYYGVDNTAGLKPFYIQSAYPPHNNPNKDSLGYFDQAYKCVDPALQTSNGAYSGIKYSDGGEIIAQPLNYFQIYCNKKNGQYTGLTRHKIAQFGSDYDNYFDGNLQIEGIANKTSGWGLVLADERHKHLGIGAYVCVFSNSSGHKEFSPINKDLNLGASGYPWQNFYLKNNFYLLANNDNNSNIFKASTKEINEINKVNDLIDNLEVDLTFNEVGTKYSINTEKLKESKEGHRILKVVGDENKVDYLDVESLLGALIVEIKSLKNENEILRDSITALKCEKEI